MLSGRYSDTNYKCLAEMMQYLVDIEDGIVPKPNESSYDNYIKAIIAEHGENEYQYHISYKNIFPSLHLEQRAKERGFQKTEVKKDDKGIETVHAYSTHKDGFKPMCINGEFVTVAVGGDVFEECGYKAMIDDNGFPQLVKTKNNYNIVTRNDELVFTEEINQWS